MKVNKSEAVNLVQLDNQVMDNNKRNTTSAKNLCLFCSFRPFAHSPSRTCITLHKSHLAMTDALDLAIAEGELHYWHLYCNFRKRLAEVVKSGVLIKEMLCAKLAELAYLYRHFT